MTVAERKLWWHLKRLNIETGHFRRQATIGPYFADFAFHAGRLVVEVDGGGHAEDTQRAADNCRTEYMISHGYRVLRFWNNEVMCNIDGVLTTIRDAYAQSLASPPTPNPSPPLRGGRGIEPQQ
jgi:very-short-patch-repair endonuclease